MSGAAELVLPGVGTGFKRGLDVGCGRTRVAGRGEMGTVVGQHGMDLVGYGRDQVSEEVAGNAARGLLVQLSKGELGGAVDGHEEVEAALFGVHLGDVDVKEADRVRLEAGPFGLVPIGVGQPSNAVALEAAV